jgi:hypothetical protein
MNAEGPGVRGRVAQGVLLASIALAPWPYGCAQDTWRFGLAAVLLLASALWRSDGGVHGHSSSALTLAALGLPTVGALQLALRTSVSPVATAEATLEVTAFFAALATFATIAQARRMTLRLAAVLLASASAQGVFGVIQSAMAPKTIYGIAPTIAQTPFGSYVNHNHFAGLIEMAVPLAIGWSLGLWRRSSGPTPAVIALAGLGLGLAAIELASRSRGGLLALIGAMSSLGLLWWIRHHRRERRALDVFVAGIVSVAVIGFAWIAVPSDVRQHLFTVARGAADSSGSYRVDVARDTLRLTVSRPWIGAGLGAYDDAIPAFKRAHGDVRTTHAESDLLQLMAETGLLGVAACGALAPVLLRELKRRQAERGDPVRRGLTLGALAGAIGLAIHSLVDFNLHIPSNALVFVGLLGLCAAPTTRPGGESERTEQGRRWATRLCALALLVLSLGAGWRAWGAWSFEQAWRRGSPQERMAALGVVLRYHPYMSDAYRERARTCMTLAASGSLAPARLTRADRDLRAALRLRPHWSEAWADEGWVLWLEGSGPEARGAFERSLALDPTHIGIREIASRFEMAERSAVHSDAIPQLK